MIENWKEAVEISKIPRINYKKILGESLTKFIFRNKHKTNEEIMKEIMIKIVKPENKRFLDGLKMEKVNENLRISLSARRAEHKIYNKEVKHGD